MNKKHHKYLVKLEHLEEHAREKLKEELDLLWEQN